MKLLSVVGTRPNFMKLAPMARALADRDGVEHVVVHTGQHYDVTMSAAFFSDLELPAPRHVLAVGPGSAPFQTSAVMSRLEPVLELERPDWVLVYGDVTSTMAASLTATQMKLRVAHIESGLRSRDRTMPEEVNRIITDHVSDLLFAPSRDAIENLRAEGVADQRIHFAGNIMIDALMEMLPRVRQSDVVHRMGVAPHQYMVVTLHRPSNVDDPVRLGELVDALELLAADRPVLFPVHPRTRQRLAAIGYRPSPAGRLRLLEPVNYSEMLALLTSARLVITDSGGLQEETTYLGVPCITVRPNTERPITCEQGTNRLVPPSRAAILDAAHEALDVRRAAPPVIERWDGKTAERIADVLCAPEWDRREHGVMEAVAAV
jgi:UDP-N-acetylglucosamine 2-epimerase (non-hydrolysing)